MCSFGFNILVSLNFTITLVHQDNKYVLLLFSMVINETRKQDRPINMNVSMMPSFDNLVYMVHLFIEILIVNKWCACYVSIINPRFKLYQVLTMEKDEPEVDILRDIGLQIIAKCDGLPLAVKVMGGLLCKKEKTRNDWEGVLNNDIWSVSQVPEELNYAIYLSYEDLPCFLKQCFLHFSLIPKKTDNIESNCVHVDW